MPKLDSDLKDYFTL